MGRDNKLKLKTIRARSYRAKTALLRAPQEEGAFSVFFVTNVVFFIKLPFNMAAAKEVDFNAVVAFWFCQGQFNSSTDCLPRMVDLYKLYGC